MKPTTWKFSAKSLWMGLRMRVLNTGTRNSALAKPKLFPLRAFTQATHGRGKGLVEVPLVLRDFGAVVYALEQPVVHPAEVVHQLAPTDEVLPETRKAAMISRQMGT